MDNLRSIREPRFGIKVEAEEWLSYQFLDFFQRTYELALQAVGQYLAKYSSITGSFKSKSMKDEEERLAEIIKENLAPILEMVDAINAKKKSSDVGKRVAAMRTIFESMIDNKKIVDKQDLIDLNEHLNTIISDLFLAPIIFRLPEKRQKVIGDVEFVSQSGEHQDDEED